MIINRYVSPVDSVYNPMSMQELAFAPTFLRQRDDAVTQQLSDLQVLKSQYDTLDQYTPIAEQLLDPLTKGIENLSAQLATKGVVGSRAIPEAMKLKSQYSQLFSPTGGVGQLQAATKQYRTRAEELKKQYEDNPLLQQYALSQLRPGEAVLQDGRVQLGNMQDARMVRHIAEEDILDRLNKAASDLKPSDLGRSGIQYTGQLGSFNDLYSIAQKQGVSFDRVDALVKSMLSGEEQLSLAQFARATGQDPEKALENFRNKMTGIAATNAISTTSFRDFNVEDKAAIAKMKGMSALTTSPGPLISRPMEDILKESGLTFDEKGENIIESTTTPIQIDKALSGESGAFWDFVGSATGYRTIKSIVGGAIDIATNPKLALAVLSGNTTAASTAWAEVNTKKEIASKIDKNIKNAIKKDMTKSVASFKESYPELAGMSNKDAYNLITESRNNFSELYSDVIAPQNGDFTYINRQILGGDNQTGDLERRQVFVGNQKIGTGSEFFKELGYSSFAEFKEKGKPSLEPGVTFGAKQPAAFVMNVLDSEGNSITATVQSNKEFEAAGRVPNKMLDYLDKGEFFKQLPNNEAIQNFGLEADKGNSWYYIYDVERSLPILVEAPENMSPREVRQYQLSNPDSEITFVDAVNSGVQSMFFGSPVGNLLQKK